MFKKKLNNIVGFFKNMSGKRSVLSEIKKKKLGLAVLKYFTFP